MMNNDGVNSAVELIRMIFQQDGLLGFYAGVGTFGLRSGGQKVGLELMQWNAASACVCTIYLLTTIHRMEVG